MSCKFGKSYHVNPCFSYKGHSQHRWLESNCFLTRSFLPIHSVVLPSCNSKLQGAKSMHLTHILCTDPWKCMSLTHATYTNTRRTCCVKCFNISNISGVSTFYSVSDIISLKFYSFFVHVRVYVYAYTCVMVCMWKLEDNSQELVLTFYHKIPGRSQAVRLGSKCFPC